MVKNKWWYYNKAISEENCKKIISLVEKYYTYESSMDGKVWSVTTSTNLKNEQWLYDLFWPYMLNANEEAGWKYDIESAEDFQVLKYNKGDSYVLHNDGGGDHLSTYNTPDNKFLNNKVRKISMISFLSDDYEGGELEVSGEIPMTKETGNLIFFPSFMSHQVKAVISGTRFSFLNWFLGPPFK